MPKNFNIIHIHKIVSNCEFFRRVSQQLLFSTNHD